MAGRQGGAILGRKTILVVDDSQDVCVLAENFLRSLGYWILTAKSGEEAMAMMDKYGGIDLLFSDVIMPGGMHGLMLAEIVRERQPALPVLLATGYMEELLCYGATPVSTDIMTKPYRLAELAERILIALEKEAVPKRSATDFQHEG